MSDGCCQAAVDSEGFAHDHAEWFAEIGRLTAERDRLAQDYVRVMTERDRAHREVSAGVKLYVAVVNERDAALASLAEERKQTARMQAVVEAWRPVVEATRAYVLDEDPRNDQFQAIVTAIDRMPWEYLNLVDPLRIPPDALAAGATVGGEGGT